jgi:putative FmdB family regulatory protein
MPTYEYACPKCEHRFEVFHGIRDESPRRCPKCRARAKRVPAVGAGLLFKGSGFYITDYRSDSYRKDAKKEKGGAAGPGGSGGGEKKKSGGSGAGD